MKITGTGSGRDDGNGFLFWSPRSLLVTVTVGIVLSCEERRQLLGVGLQRSVMPVAVWAVCCLLVFHCLRGGRGEGLLL